MQLSVLMPMGGLGQRFADAGYTTPKPMIEVDGSPMFLKALESFPDSWDIEKVFVIRADQNERYDLKRLIEDACPGARVAVLDHNTRGAVESCLAAEGLLNKDKPVIVADCDLRFSSQDYVDDIERGIYDGVLVGFDSRDPRYSYAEVNDEGIVVRTAEKDPISDHALIGGYYFSSGARFLDLAHRFLDEGLPEGMKEYYLSQLYNLLLQEGGRIAYAKADAYDSWGTPEELDRYVMTTGQASQASQGA